jgi:hypothetical protein
LIAGIRTLSSNEDETISFYPASTKIPAFQWFRSFDAYAVFMGMVVLSAHPE